MADIEMPQLGETVTEGTITKWFKEVGDQVAEDEVLFEVSTDKVDSEVPSPVAGFLAEIRVPEGDTVDVGTVLAVVADAPPAGGPAAAAPEAQPAADDAAGAAAAAPPPAERRPPPHRLRRGAAAPCTAGPGARAGRPAEPSPAPPLRRGARRAGHRAGAGERPGGGRRLLSPLVRRLIAEQRPRPGVDPGHRHRRSHHPRRRPRVIDRQGGAGRRDGATGPPAGRAGAPRLAARRRPGPPPPPPRFARAPATPSRSLDNMRRITGDHMVMSKATSPHAMTAVEVDYENVERVRRPNRDEFKAKEGFSLTYLPFISRAVIDALRDFPHMNASVGDGELIGAPLRQPRHRRRPRLRGPDRRPSSTRPTTSGCGPSPGRSPTWPTRARTKKLSADDITGGTFTISNSGPFGTFMAIAGHQPAAGGDPLHRRGDPQRPVVVTDADGNEADRHPLGRHAGHELGPPGLRRRLRGGVPARGQADPRDPRLGGRAGMTPTLRVRWLGSVPYADAHAPAAGLFGAVAAPGSPRPTTGCCCSSTRTSTRSACGPTSAHLLVPPAEVGADLVRADRGGDVTYHGPGQLVGYPILSVPGKRRGGMADTAAYVRGLEQLRDRRPRRPRPAEGRPARSGYPGVWVDADGAAPRKIAAIGVRLTRGRTMHGFALNVDPDLAMFDHIVPCGIADKAVTSLAAEGIDVDHARRGRRRRRPRFAERSARAAPGERQDVVWHHRPDDLSRLQPRRGPRHRRPSAGDTAQDERRRRGPGRRTGRAAALGRLAGGGEEAGPSPTRKDAGRVDAGPGRPWAPEYLQLKRTMRDLDLRHGVRGGGLPQHLRVLGRRHRHVHDQRRAVHPGLRVLPGRHPHARGPSTRTSRRGWPRPSTRMGLRHAVRHRGGPRRPGRRWRRRASRPRSTRSAASARVPRSRCSSPTARATPTSLADVFDARPDVLEPQRRDGAPGCSGRCARRPATPAAWPCWPGPRRPG